MRRRSCPAPSAPSLANALALAALIGSAPTASRADYEPTGLVQDPKTDESDARGACVQGTTLYLISDEAGTQQLNVFDVSDIAGASADFSVPETSLDASGFTNGVQCVDDVLYAHGANGIRVYDVSSPLAPSIATTRDPGLVYTLFVSGGNLIATGPFGAAVYSLTDPLAPTLLDTLSIEADERAYAGTVAGSTLYLGVYNFDTTTPSLVSADFSNPADLGMPSSTVVQDFVYHLRPSAGSLLALTNDSARLYDISTPSAPLQISSLGLSGRSLTERGDNYIVNGKVFQTTFARAGVPTLTETDTFPTGIVTSGLPHLGAALGDYAFFITSAGAVVLADFLFLDGFEGGDLSGWDGSSESM